MEMLKLYFSEYVKNGGIVSPMNTESCRRYIQEKINREVTPEDVLWLFYHTEKGEK